MNPRHQRPRRFADGRRREARQAPPPDRHIKVSVMISIYNAPGNERAELLTWGLRYLHAQTLSANEWEVVLVDDMSDRDIVPAFEPFIGKMNITHLKMDHRRHPIWKEMNPKRATTVEKENWPHTPALSTNLAAKHSRGQVLCFSQPEVLAEPTALNRGYLLSHRKKLFVFTELVLTPPIFRKQFLEIGQMFPFPEIWHRAIGSLEGKDPVKYKAFHAGENYWIFAFLDREWFFRINGVDEEFLRGVYAEDDNFRNRTELIGVKTFRDSATHAVHLNTEHETHKKQQRDKEPWLSWAKTNRTRQSQFLAHPQSFGNHLANIGKDWGSETAVVEICHYRIS